MIAQVTARFLHNHLWKMFQAVLDFNQLQLTQINLQNKFNCYQRISGRRDIIYGRAKQNSNDLTSASQIPTSTICDFLLIFIIYTGAIIKTTELIDFYQSRNHQWPTLITLNREVKNLQQEHIICLDLVCMDHDIWKPSSYKLDGHKNCGLSGFYIPLTRLPSELIIKLP